MGESLRLIGRTAVGRLALFLSALVLALWVTPAGARENESSEPPRTIESYAILATDVLWLGRGTSVEAGHVGVNEVRKPFFARGRPIEAWIGRGVRLDGNSALVADSIWFGRDVFGGRNLRQ